MRRHQRQQARAEALARALDGRPVRDDVLARESEELVRYAEAILRSAHPEPDPTFASDLRASLMTQAPAALGTSGVVVHVRPVEDAPTSSRHRVRTLVAAVTVAAASFGLVATSAQAIPGETLYPVKQGVERVELALERGPVGTGRKQLELASERLDEVDALATRGISRREAPLVDTALAEFTRRARAGSEALLGAYGRDGDAAAAARVDAFTARSTRTIESLQDRLPASAAAPLASAAAAVVGIADDTSQVCQDCSPTAPSQPGRDISALPTDPPVVQGPAPSAAAPSAPAAGAPSASAAPSAQPSSPAPTTPAPTPSTEVTAPVVPVPILPDPVRALTPLLEGILDPSPTTPPASEPLGPIPGVVEDLLGGGGQPTTEPTP
ncbi:MAG: DUF5667 domain-containing protein [Nocardioidaceae bacterium]|nr:DUF5667 domain-containing protein [Nocardioidaceae bacterium]